MEAFWAILSGTIILRWWWKSGRPEEPVAEVKPVAISSLDKKTKKETEADKLQKEVDKRREKDIADLRRQGYTDELIAVILPTLYNDGQ